MNSDSAPQSTRMLTRERWTHRPIFRPEDVVAGIATLAGRIHRDGIELGRPSAWIARAHVSVLLAETTDRAKVCSAYYTRAAEDLALACLARSIELRDVPDYSHAAFLNASLQCDMSRLDRLPTPTSVADDITALIDAATFDENHLHAVCATLCSLAASA